MHPILLSIGPVTIYSFSLFIVLAWCVFSFLFWKSLRQSAIDEDKIFDLTFYATFFSFLVARFVFVLFHWELFTDSWLKIVAIWVQPGLSFYGGLLGAVFVFVVMSKPQKVRLGLIIDAFAQSFPMAAILGSIATFLDGTTPGLVTNVPWAMRTVGQVGLLHPVSLYHMLMYIILTVLVGWFVRKSTREKSPYGMVGVLFFIVMSVCLFAIEFVSVRTVYWISLSAKQWALIAVFAESMGAFYVRGGGRERLRPTFNKIYAKFSKRHS